jgi:hypothetical protein
MRSSLGLEARDDNWSDSAIIDLLKYYDYVIDDKFINEFQSNKISFLKYILTTPGY